MNHIALKPEKCSSVFACFVFEPLELLADIQRLYKDARDDFVKFRETHAGTEQIVWFDANDTRIKRFIERFIEDPSKMRDEAEGILRGLRKFLICTETFRGM